MDSKLTALQRDVLDESPQRHPEKPTVGRIRMDAADEILANKLCALLSRAELRDLVDVRALEEAGHSVEEALPFAQAKDTGLTPAQLAWVLSQIRIDNCATIPGGATAAEIRAYLHALIQRLARLAHPDPDASS